MKITLSKRHMHVKNFLWCLLFQLVFTISKIQLVVFYQCCVLIGWATTRLYVMVH